MGVVLATALVACADRKIDEDTGLESGGGTDTTGTTGGTETTGTPTSSGTPPGTSGPPTSTSTSTSTSTGTEPGPSTDDATAAPTTAEDSGDIDPIACDVFAQDCPEGQKCAPYAKDGGTSWDALKCVPITGDGQPGDLCTAQESGFSGLDDCAEGVFCWTVEETLQGTCSELCSGPPAEPVCDDPDVSCIVPSDGVLNLCLLPCDPLQQDCVGGKDLCIPVGETFACLIDASGDEGQVFDPCEFANVCDEGLLCHTPQSATECDQSATGCCLPFCDLADADPMCPGVGQSCLPFFEAGMAPPKFANVGVCAIGP